MTTKRGLALVVLVAACRRNDPPSPPTTAASSSASAPAPAVASASASASISSADAAPPARRYRPAEDCPNADETIRAARAFAAEDAREDARDAYRDAILVRPFDPNLRIEYARFESYASSARYQLLLAISMTQDRAIRAKAWTALAAQFENDTKKDYKEAARLSYAMAERYGSTEAPTKLGASSHCPALWTTTNDPELSAEMPREGGQKRTAGEVVIRSIVGGLDPLFSSLNPGKIGGTLADDFIDGTGTWNRDQRKCKVSPWPPPGLPRQSWPRGGSQTPLDGAPAPDLPKTTRTRFATTNGKFLFSLVSYFPDVTATIANGKAHVSGKGCDVDVDLP